MISKASLGEALAPRLIAPEFLPIYEAARFVERLLPEECPCGINEGFLDPCPRCQDTGQVWDEGLIEVVAEALHDAPYDGCDKYQQMQVRAVLAALAQEVGK